MSIFRLLFVSVLAMQAAACTQNDSTRSFTVSDCAQVRLAGRMQAIVRRGEENRLAIRGTAADIANIDLKPASQGINLSADGGVVELVCTHLLQLEVLDEVSVLLPVSTGESTPLSFNLQKVAAYGNSEVTIERLISEQLDIRSSSRAKINIDQISTERIEALVSAKSEVHISGDTHTLHIEISSSAQLSSETLTAQSVYVKARGDSVTTIKATAHLTLDVRVPAVVTHIGTPDITIIEPQ
ncbi:MAG: hypothetical protein GXP16_16375 [Gammaproteobacteria bacterium]|nr:hypothetical protein [Gammaproteobacteria bacterium]